MEKKKAKKLLLTRESIRKLSPKKLTVVVGGVLSNEHTCAPNGSYDPNTST
jgi:hypothetical protein